ncbi:MAG: hypothetical protein PF439_12250 [Helicobacteraceae bacterium]|jgi:hypothetical protein|nr:hypothetical protein [Helicobacteraceae bacterium]
MSIRSWAIKVENKKVLNTLITMVEKQELEEIFLCEITEDNAVANGFKKGNKIAIVANKKEAVKGKLQALGQCVLLDDLEDEMFDIDEDGAALKGVRYPESEDDELEMLQSLS